MPLTSPLTRTQYADPLIRFPFPRWFLAMNSPHRAFICSLMALLFMASASWAQNTPNPSETDDDQKTQSATTGTALPCPQTARGLEGDPGDRLHVVCPANCTGPLVWGSGVYADDSSVCAAARHAGAYDGTTRSIVIIEFLPGQASYERSVQNGVTSHRWGAWPRSFTVHAPGAPTARTTMATPQARSTFDIAPQAPSSNASSSAAANAAANAKTDAKKDKGQESTQDGKSPDVFARSTLPNTDAKNAKTHRAQTVDCSLRGDELSGDKGTKHIVRCPSGCGNERVWGSGPYNDDSSVCASAIHAGAIPHDAGGLIRVTITGEVYDAAASTAHHVSSQAWTYWPRSFRVEGIR